MKILGIIPARYASTRLPGKPLADICGKPMIWWVYNQAKKVKNIDDIYVAVDNKKVYDVCNEYNMNVIMTNSNHPSHVHRLYECATKIDADAYICICGDEPIIEPEVIEKIVPKKTVSRDELYISGLMRYFSDPVEAIDSGNIKIITNKDGYALSFSRTPIPYPYKTVNYKIKKTIGIECFNKKALDFFVNSEKGEWEKVEDIMMLRFVENRIPVHFSLVNSSSLSVDTEKDLDKIRNIIKNQRS